jgi:hypothetical protein
MLSLQRLTLAVILALAASACSGSIKVGGDDGDDDDDDGPTDEDFPAELLDPWDGPPSDVYDNTFINYRQLRGRVQAVFEDDWVRGGVDQFELNRHFFGGADFVERFTEPRVATTEFLLGLDTLAPDVCNRAVTMRTGPFAGFDPSTAIGAGSAGNIDAVYQRMLYRTPSDAERTEALDLLTDVVALPQPNTAAWAALCEALVRSPDFVFTLPPSIKTATGDDKKRLLLVKVATDLVARPATAAELDAFVGGTKDLAAMVDDYLASEEFRDYYFHKIRLRTESAGTEETDEPARLWTYLAISGEPFQLLFTADFTVDTGWNKATRPAVHGATGILTMKGFLSTKPGLPSYNYSARVMGDFLGQTFEVPPSIIEMRAGSTAASTVDPNSLCYGCHRTLTPLAFQRLRWADDGTYRETDESGAVIDDSDRGMVPDYAFAGQGMAGFAARAIKKEAFIRRMLNMQYGFLVGRDMRLTEDERTTYKRLWDLNIASQGDLRAIIKDIILSPTYQGGAL